MSITVERRRLSQRLNIKERKARIGREEESFESVMGVTDEEASNAIKTREQSTRFCRL